MLQAITHVAIALDDLEAAESFYADIFDMEVYVRESKTEDGWKTLDG